MRPRMPEWLLRVCRCSVCSQTLLVTEGGTVSCFWPGHTGLIRPGDFAELVGAAWRAARKVGIVRWTEAAAVRKAMAAVRGTNPAAARPVGDGGSTRAHADLFASLPVLDSDRATDVCT